MTLRQPPEWSRHEAVWIGFPSHPDLWEDDLGPARAEVLAFAHAVHADGHGETVRLIAADEEAAFAARALVQAHGAQPGVEVHHARFGDIWLRDTGPIVLGQGRARVARDFGFNGWGGKYRLESDDTIGRSLAESADLPLHTRDWILEGGAIDVDGTGLAVTTEQCLLNPNRNPGMTRADVEARLRDDLGITSVLWLGEGLINDHTDGHVDNLARFVAEGVIAIPEPANNDPNGAIYADAWARAEAFGLDVVRLPSPGHVEREGELIPASYMNFYIGNAAVVVPQYGAANDKAAVDAIAALFLDRQCFGFRSDHILTGGGSFHCISQQIPL